MFPSVYSQFESNMGGLTNVGRGWKTGNPAQGTDIALARAECLLCAGLISKSQALMRLKPELIDQLLHPTLDPKAKKQVIAKASN